MLALLSGCQDYAITRSQVADLFEQAGREGAVDVLWIEDDSATMYEEQAALGEHAGAFIGVLATSPLPFRLAVATTGGDGALVGPVLASDTDGLTEAFVGQVVGLPVGDRVERGLAAAIGAAGGGFAGDADLEVVVHADEDDQTDGETAGLVDALRATRAGSVRLHAIVGDPPEGCFSRAAAADPGLRYIEAAGLTEGVRSSICDPDLDTMLTRVGHAVLGLETSFPLTALPVLDSTEVYVDDALIPRRDVDGWSYDAVANAVVFSGWAVPRPGSWVKVRYWDWTQGSPPDTGG